MWFIIRCIMFWGISHIKMLPTRTYHPLISLRSGASHIINFAYLDGKKCVKTTQKNIKSAIYLSIPFSDNNKKIKKNKTKQKQSTPKSCEVTLFRHLFGILVLASPVVNDPIQDVSWNLEGNFHFKWTRVQAIMTSTFGDSVQHGSLGWMEAKTYKMRKSWWENCQLVRKLQCNIYFKFGWQLVLKKGQSFDLDTCTHCPWIK